MYFLYFAFIMKNFISYVLPFRSTFEQIAISRRELSVLENLIIRYLSVRDLNELRDRFEGQAFLDNYLQKAVPLMGLQKYLKTSLIDFEAVSPDKVKSEVIIKGNKVKIIQFGNHLPLLDTSDKLPCIFIYFTQKQIVELCGFASAYTVQNSITDIKKFGFGSTETMKGSFYGFDKLKMFESIDDLSELLKL